jgi:hypothetical protein
MDLAKPERLGARTVTGAPGASAKKVDRVGKVATRDPITLFSWGYWGWGNATPQLVEAVDAVERGRGFAPPLFVDVRLRREVRAVGFRGDAFGETVGRERYRWLRGLGNAAIANGGSMRLANAAAVNDLLELAVASAGAGQRVIFYCSCELRRGCHRNLVASKTEKAARKAGVDCRIVEWPGGEPVVVRVSVADEMIGKVLGGRRSVPVSRSDLGERFGELAGLPWGSIAVLTSPRRSLPVLTGPAQYQKGWVLPLVGSAVSEGDAVEGLKVEAGKLRRRNRWDSPERDA